MFDWYRDIAVLSGFKASHLVPDMPDMNHWLLIGNRSLWCYIGTGHAKVMRWFLIYGSTPNSNRERHLTLWT
jgi:hypothetical protein